MAQGVIAPLGGGLARIKALVLRYAHLNWTLIDQIVVSGSNFLTAMIVARFLGLEEFGTFSIVFLVVLFLYSFQAALLLSPMLSIGPKQQPGHSDRYFGAIVSLQVGFTLLAAGTAASIMLMAGDLLGVGERGGALALPVALAVTASQVQEFLRRYCFARERAAVALRMDALRAGMQLAGLVALFSGWGGSVSDALFVISGSALLAAAVAIPELPRPLLVPATLAEAAQRHWNMSKWLLPSSMMQWTSGNLFMLAAGGILGPSAVGAMRAAQTLMGVTQVGFEALHNWAPVRAARIHAERGNPGVREFLKRLLLLVGSGTAIAALLIAIPAGYWLRLLFGTEYVPYGWLVACYGATYVLMALSMPYMQVFVAIEQTRPVFVSYLAATTLSVLSVFPLLSVFGLPGAMAGTIMTTACLTGTLALYGRRLLRGNQARQHALKEW